MGLQKDITVAVNTNTPTRPKRVLIRIADRPYFLFLPLFRHSCTNTRVSYWKSLPPVLRRKAFVCHALSSLVTNLTCRFIAWEDIASAPDYRRFTCTGLPAVSFLCKFRYIKNVQTIARSELLYGYFISRIFSGFWRQSKTREITIFSGSV